VLPHVVKDQDQFQHPFKTSRQLEECRKEKPFLVTEAGSTQGSQTIAKARLGQ
jgi:hypothetical protein